MIQGMPTEGVRFIRLPQVLDMTGLSRASIYAYMDDDKFPAPVPLGGRAVRWIESEVIAWQQSKIKARDGRGDRKPE